MSLLLPRRAFLKAAALAAPALWLPSREIVRPAAAQIPGMMTALGTNISASFATDFREYATGSPPGDWTKIGATTTETWNINSNAAAVGGHDLSPTPVAATTMFKLNRAGASNTDGEIFTIIKSGATTGVGVYNHGLFLRGANAADTFYTLILGNDTNAPSGAKLGIYSVTAGVGAALAAVAVAWAANTVYAMRFRVQSTTLSAKVWAWPGAESGASTTSVTDGSIASGACGVVSGNNVNTVQGTFQFFSYANGAGVAPYPSG